MALFDTLVDVISAPVQVMAPLILHLLEIAFDSMSALAANDQTFIILSVIAVMAATFQEPGFIFIPAQQLRVGIFAMACGLLTILSALVLKNGLETTEAIQNWWNGPPPKLEPAVYEREEKKPDWKTPLLFGFARTSTTEHSSGIIGPSPHIVRKRLISPGSSDKNSVRSETRSEATEQEKQQHERPKRWHWNKNTHRVEFDEFD